jgi:hypothetical protein
MSLSALSPLFPQLTGRFLLARFHAIFRICIIGCIQGKKLLCSLNQLQEAMTVMGQDSLPGKCCRTNNALDGILIGDLKNVLKALTEIVANDMIFGLTLNGRSVPKPANGALHHLP